MTFLVSYPRLTSWACAWPPTLAVRRRQESGATVRGHRPALRGWLTDSPTHGERIPLGGIRNRVRLVGPVVQSGRPPRYLAKAPILRLAVDSSTLSHAPGHGKAGRSLHEAVFSRVTRRPPRVPLWGERPVDRARHVAIGCTGGTTKNVEEAACRHRSVGSHQVGFLPRLKPWASASKSFHVRTGSSTTSAVAPMIASLSPTGRPSADSS